MSNFTLTSPEFKDQDPLLARRPWMTLLGGCWTRRRLQWPPRGNLGTSTLPEALCAGCSSTSSVQNHTTRTKTHNLWRRAVNYKPQKPGPAPCTSFALLRQDVTFHAMAAERRRGTDTV